MRVEMTEIVALVGVEVLFFLVVIYLTTRNLESWMQRNKQPRRAVVRKRRG
jgi:hypothetical protein